MKKWVMIILCALLCMLYVSGICQDAAGVFMRAYPLHVLEAFAENGNTAAAVMMRGEERRLLVAQRSGDAWMIEIDNPNALGGGVDALALEREDTISWTYKDRETHRTSTYSAAYTGGEWGALQVEVVYDHEYFTSARSVTWRDGLLVTEGWSRHNGDSARSRQEIMPVPASWMEEKVKLAHFDPDENLYSNGLDYDWLSREVVQHAAAELLPDYVFVDGNAQYDGLVLLMDRLDGERVFVGCTYDERFGFVLCESMPLPGDAEASIGYENFTGALVLGWQRDESGRSIPLQLKPYADGVWGVHDNVGFIDLMLGKNYLRDEYGRYTFGTHPWSDIQTVNWRNLPQTREQILAGSDASGWATPNSANPEDRLHLRAAPRKDAVSLGKYYNGTPVEVIEQLGEWTHVRVLGVEGYMMTQYLAFGRNAADVDQRVDSYLLTGEEAALYAHVKDEKPVCTIVKGPAVVGVLGNDWYHVWDPESGRSGFVRQGELWPGNG